ncbi:MAG: hypothetical protein M0P12_03035 [Paludibacteraceae bacterium]|nr:hypothetical protein [Paludibacteraceae bacterium]
MINVNIEQISDGVPLYDKAPGKSAIMALCSEDNGKSIIIVKAPSKFLVPLGEPNPDWLKAIAETISVAEKHGNKTAKILIQRDKIGVYSVEE